MGRCRRGTDDGFEIGGVLGQLLNFEVGSTDVTRCPIGTAPRGDRVCRDAKQAAPPLLRAAEVLWDPWRT